MLAKPRGATAAGSKEKGARRTAAKVECSARFVGTYTYIDTRKSPFFLVVIRNSRLFLKAFLASLIYRFCFVEETRIFFPNFWAEWLDSRKEPRSHRFLGVGCYCCWWTVGEFFPRPSKKQKFEKYRDAVNAWIIALPNFSRIYSKKKVSNKFECPILFPKLENWKLVGNRIFLPREGGGMRDRSRFRDLSQEPDAAGLFFKVN